MPEPGQAATVPLMQGRVLIIDDDEALAAMLAEYLAKLGFSVETRPDAAQGLAKLGSAPFDVLLLDAMLPDADGFDVCRRLRQEKNPVPIVMLTARGDDVDRIVGLELGADDYVPKPFNPRELVARIRALLRRTSRSQGPATETNALRFGRLVIDRDARQVLKDGRPCPVTPLQFALLLLLAESAERVLTRETILDRLRRENLEPFDRSIDVLVSRLRAAVEDDPRRPNWILTVRGAGYRFARGSPADG